MSVTESREEDVGSASVPPVRPARRPAQSPFSPLFWRSPIRGPWLTSFLGTLLVPAIAIPALFHFPRWWPSWGYALSQGTHVTLGLMTLPIVLAKLWSVMPKLFRRPI